MADNKSACSDTSTWTDAVMTPSHTTADDQDYKVYPIGNTPASFVRQNIASPNTVEMGNVRRYQERMAHRIHEAPRPATELKCSKGPPSVSYPAALPEGCLDVVSRHNYFRQLGLDLDVVVHSYIRRGNLWFVFGESAANLIYLMYISHSKRGLSNEKVAYYTLWDVLAEKAVLSVKHEFTLREHREKISIEDAYGHVIREMLLELGTRIDQKIQDRSP